LAHLVIDLAEVTFMGSSGLASLLRAQRLLTESSATLELREPSQTVRDLLAMTHLTDRFTISTRTGT
jgi:anti-anti-sigma factor